MNAGAPVIDNLTGRNRRMRFILLVVAAALAVFTVVYIALHRHV